MKRIVKMSLILGVVFAVLSGAADSSCGGVNSSPKKPAPVVKLTAVTLDGAVENNQMVNVGHKLVAKLTPENATNPTYKWMIASGDANSSYTAIAGATSSSYTPKIIDSDNKKIRVSVTAGGVTISSKEYNVGVAGKKVFLSLGSLGTAGERKITGLTTGKKYKITVVDGTASGGDANSTGTVKYSVADGNYANFKDIVGDAVKLTSTEITGLQNDTTYKVEVIN